ncbi:hypothetical protein ACHAXA_000064, partial [Cyclostephanos tholiformis]
ASTATAASGGGRGGECDGGDDGGSVSRRVANVILGHASSRLWGMMMAGGADDDRGARDDDDDDGGGLVAVGATWDDNDDSDIIVHPMCEAYRNLRRRAHFRKAYIPWNWYHRTDIRVLGLALRGGSSSTMTSDDGGGGCDADDGPSTRWWTMGWIEICGDGGGQEEGAAIPHRPNVEYDESCTIHNSSTRSSYLPPSISIETMHISIRSLWSRPIVSAHIISGITMSIVLRRGELFPLVNRHGIIDGMSLLIGDMTLREFVDILPRPPEMEGTYPRIGNVNITNVTLCVYEYDGTGEKDDNIDNKRGTSLKLLFKIEVPDEFFVPIKEMTLAHERDGIDRKHFQPMVESSISIALRRHLLREATAALRNSWISAHDQLHKLILHTQELYVNKWIEIGEHAWRQGVVDGAAPMVRAMEEWLVDIRDIVSEPIHPLAVVLSHHWNRTVDVINKHGISIDGQLLWGHFNDMADRAINFKQGKAISKHLHDLKEAVDLFIAKSGHEVELLLKEMRLEWHHHPLPES